MITRSEMFEPKNPEEVSPLGVAAGWIKFNSLEEALEQAGEIGRSPVSFVTAGSVTIEEREGNPDVNYYYDEKRQAAYNAMGLPGPGLEKVLKYIPDIRQRLDEATPQGEPRKHLGLSISPAIMEKEQMTSFDQIKYMLEKLMDVEEIDYIEINLSCPNVVDVEGGRKPIAGYDPQFVFQLIDYLNNNFDENDKIIGLKLPPYITEEQIDNLTMIGPFILTSPAVGYIATANTIPGQIPTDSEGKEILSVGAGGMSGPATAQEGRNQLELWCDLMKRSGFKQYIMSMLGVDTGMELSTRLEMGAHKGAVLTPILKGRGIVELVRIIDEMPY